MRYLCGSVIDCNVGEIIAPVVEVLADWITEAQLAADLNFFVRAPPEQGGFMENHKALICNAERLLPKIGAGGSHGVVNS